MRRNLSCRLEGVAAAAQVGKIAAITHGVGAAAATESLQRCTTGGIMSQKSPLRRNLINNDSKKPRKKLINLRQNKSWPYQLSMLNRILLP